MLFGYHWDTSSPLAFAISILPILLRGMIVTLQAAALGFVIAAILGLIFAALRGVPSRLVAWPTMLIVEFFRDTPLLVQLYFLYFVLPEYGLLLPAFLTGAVALGVQYSAYMSEVYRAGLEAVPRGQHEAARVLNLPPAHTFIKVIVPQALPRIIPALGNYLISIMKDVPVLSVVTVVEMLSVAKIIGDRTFQYLIPLTMVGALYLILTLLAAYLVRTLDVRLPKRGIPLK